MKSKKAAMEMSVGTIVTIVLLMSVLVLGLFLVKSIFSSAKGAVDLTDQQLQAEIEKLFSEEKKLVIYPTSAKLNLKIGESDAIGIGIKNIATSADAPTTFSYEVLYMDNDCGLSKEQVMQWIRLGATGENIPIPIGGFETARITFRVPEGVPICLADFRVHVKKGETNPTTHDSEIFSIEVKP